MSDQRHIEAFLEMLIAERGRARLTIEAYRRDLADFTGFLARRGGAASRRRPVITHIHIIYNIEQ